MARQTVARRWSRPWPAGMTVLALVLLLAPRPGAGQAISDHLLCYTLEDPEKLKGVIDVTPPQFTALADCKLSKTVKLCVPASKVVDRVTTNKVPLTPLPIVGPPAAGDYLCYKLTCDTTGPGSVPVEDQFGLRRVEIGKVAQVCTPATKQSRVFVTSAGYTGDLGGLAGADAKCQARADAAGLGGRWAAWLSTAAVDARDRVPDRAYVLVDGTRVADSLADLTDGTLDAAIGKDETGAAVAGAEAWTATLADGTGSGGCGDWTATTGVGLVGLSDRTDSQWSFAYAQLCDRTVRLYCFEQ